MIKKWQKFLKIYLFEQKTGRNYHTGIDCPVLALPVLKTCLEHDSVMVAALPDSTAAEKLASDIECIAGKLQLDMDLLIVPECGRGKLLFPGGETRRANSPETVASYSSS